MEIFFEGVKSQFLNCDPVVVFLSIVLSEAELCIVMGEKIINAAASCIVVCCIP